MELLSVPFMEWPRCGALCQVWSACAQAHGVTRESNKVITRMMAGLLVTGVEREWPRRCRFARVCGGGKGWHEYISIKKIKITLDQADQSIESQASLQSRKKALVFTHAWNVYQKSCLFTSSPATTNHMAVGLNAHALPILNVHHRHHQARVRKLIV